MPPLTLQILAKSKSSRHNRRKGEAPEEFVKQLTHVTASGLALTDMAAIHSCKQATTLYLYENRLTRIAGLAACRNLTQVCLQHNKIKRIEGLGNLTRLRKLRLGHNAISVVEGLQQCPYLEELHLENQMLPPGEMLVFDPRTIRVLSQTLTVLNVAGNRLEDLRDIAGLRRLGALNISSNFVRNLKELKRLLETNRGLQRLWVGDNPLCHTKRFRDNIIVMSNSLRVLDDKAVSEMTRQFLVNWARHKEMKAAGLLPPPAPQPTAPAHAGKSKALGTVSKPKFPSKFSSRNPHWVPPLPTKRKKGPGSVTVGSSSSGLSGGGGAIGNSGRGGGYGGGGGGFGGVGGSGGGGNAGYANASYGSNNGYGGNSYGGGSSQPQQQRQQQPPPPQQQYHSNNYGGDAYGGY